MIMTKNFNSDVSIYDDLLPPWDFEQQPPSQAETPYNTPEIEYNTPEIEYNPPTSSEPGKK